jgi:hypothetical protein
MRPLRFFDPGGPNVSEIMPSRLWRNENKWAVQFKIGRDLLSAQQIFFANCSIGNLL